MFSLSTNTAILDTGVDEDILRTGHVILSGQTPLEGTNKETAGDGSRLSPSPRVQGWAGGSSGEGSPFPPAARVEESERRSHSHHILKPPASPSPGRQTVTGVLVRPKRLAVDTKAGPPEDCQIWTR